MIKCDDIVLAFLGACTVTGVVLSIVVMYLSICSCIKGQIPYEYIADMMPPRKPQRVDK